MDVAHERHRLAEREVHRAVVQLVAPDLVEADAHVDRGAITVDAMQVCGEPSRRDGVLAHPSLEEVAAQRRFGEADEPRARLERGALREQLPDPGEVAGVVALARLKLGEGEREEGSHARRIATRTGYWQRLVESGGWRLGSDRAARSASRVCVAVTPRPPLPTSNRRSCDPRRSRNPAGSIDFDECSLDAPPSHSRSSSPARWSRRRLSPRPPGPRLPP